MKKLLDKFKALPPELRMMISLAGITGPIGIVYFIKKFGPFKDIPTLYLILGLGAIVAVIALLATLWGKLFSAGRKSRTGKMASEMASEDRGGPVSMGVRAAIKENNTNFFNAIRETRKATGVSVYDQPWYILIGDSGCGKTKLVNESGLTFPLGKPEGYQLGTLNYNWWFAEEAVFLDMAGRLCNPQDDADRKEWEAFLGTVANGRKGYPINGALMCISAEHLLEDSAEKHEEYANVALERLRDLQNKLGVTFATYLVITKCDKILGFMQFFDRANQDIKVKNQIFGWSREGNFSDPYDPEDFPKSFKELYHRLNDLRLRRINDDADEVELGLAYNFAEAFRELEAPLQIYTRTLFPLMRNPRAVKNLVFRGIYFTSATQQGSIILKHLIDRLGRDTADQFAPLESMYPKPRPLFVKDLLVQKVVPEQGLVFRSEKHLIRNKKLSRMLRYGTVVLALLLTGLLSWSCNKFDKLIMQPTEHASLSQSSLERADSKASLQLVGQLGGDITLLKENPWSRRVLSLGYKSYEPIDHLADIRRNLFEKGVLGKVLQEVITALRTPPPDEEILNERDVQKRQEAQTKFFAALKEYLRWYAYRDAPQLPEASAERFKTLCAVIGPNTFTNDNRDQLMSEFDAYVSTGRGGAVNPASALDQVETSGPDTLREAMKTCRFYLERYAKINSQHPDPTIREWMRIHDACSTVIRDYNHMLDSQSRVANAADLKSFKETFEANYNTFKSSLGATGWYVTDPTKRQRKIDSLAQAVADNRKRWITLEDEFRQTYLEACKNQNIAPETAISSAIGQMSKVPEGVKDDGLDQLLRRTLLEANLMREAFRGEDPLEHLTEYVNEVPATFPYIISLRVGDEQIRGSDEVVLVRDATWVDGKVAEILGSLKKTDFGKRISGEETLDDWADRFEQLRKMTSGQVTPLEDPNPPLHQAWRYPDLKELYEKREKIGLQGEYTSLLMSMEYRLDHLGPWGVAELARNYRTEVPSVYGIPIPEDLQLRTQPEERPRETERPQEQDTGPRRPKLGSAEETPSRPAADAPPVAPPAGGIRGPVRPYCSDLNFMRELIPTWMYVALEAQAVTPDKIFLDGTEPTLNVRVVQKLNGQKAKYYDQYVAVWNTAYSGKSLAGLDTLTSQANSWKSLGQDMNPPAVTEQLRGALEELLRNLGRLAGTSPPINVTDRTYSDLNDANLKDIERAIAGGWDRNRSFISVYKAPDGVPGDPWDAVAGAFAGRWRELAGAVAASADLPMQFDATTRTLPEIPWGRIRALRGELHMETDKLTEQLERFEDRGQSLLDRELDQVLKQLESRYFSGQTADGGWPYVVGGMGTLEFNSFRKFLVEVKRAQSVLGTLDNGLSGSNGRNSYYNACNQWHDFLMAGNSEGPRTLKITVERLLPSDERHPKDMDTPHHFYNSIELDLGGAQLGFPTATVPLSERTREASWDWQPAKDLSIALKSPLDSVYPLLTKKIFDRSPLALCAFLRGRFGREDTQVTMNRIAVYRFDLRSEFQDAAAKKALDTKVKDKGALTTVGGAFLFKLDRSMPAEITPRP